MFIVYLLWLSPALILMFWAQLRVKSTFAKAQRIPARLSGAGAARLILDSAGLNHVSIEQVSGSLSDHYDPRSKVLRLSKAVYETNSTAAVGIAAHEAGHALQDARHYSLLVIRNAAVPAATFGGKAFFLMLIAGSIFRMPSLIVLGILAFVCVVVFQIINLPVEFDASNRAKCLLVEHNIVAQHDMIHVNRVLNAAAWTYVAATLQAVLTLLYYVLPFGGQD